MENLGFRSVISIQNEYDYKMTNISKKYENMISSYQGANGVDHIFVNINSIYIEKILGVYKIFTQVSDHSPLIVDLESK